MTLTTEQSCGLLILATMRKFKSAKDASNEPAQHGRTDASDGRISKNIDCPLLITPVTIKPHPLAAIFPELPPEELNQLVRDIRERGQLEPIIIYKGLILDGQNRYKACKIVGIKPRIEEFDAKLAKRSPEEFVLSRNLRRRHLSGGQKAAIALDWSERMEFSPKVEKTKVLGRPKGPIPDAARQIGINEQRVFEVRQVRDASARLYQEVKSGRRSLNSALDEIRPHPETSINGAQSGVTLTPFQQEEDWKKAHEEEEGVDRSMGTILKPGPGRPAHKEASSTANRLSVLAPPLPSAPPSPAALEKALARIKAVMGTWFYAEVKAINLVQKQEEIIHLSKLTDTQMQECGAMLKKGWVFAEALREVVDKLTPDDDIRSLHTRALESGGSWSLVTVGTFGHVVVWGSEKDQTLAKIKDFLGKLAGPQRSTGLIPRLEESPKPV